MSGTSVIIRNIAVHTAKDGESRLTLGIAKADPYVVFQLGGAEAQTQAAEEAGKHARWGGVTLQGVNLSQSSELRVLVKDKNTGRKDSFIGEGTIPLRELQDGRTQVVRLYSSSRADAGELEFTLDSRGGFSSYSGGGYQQQSTTTTTGYSAGAAGYSSGTTTGQTSELRQYEGNPVCDTKTYSTTEDRPVTREVVERVVEHRPVQKQFVVETRPVGERELIDQRYTEVLGTTERIVRVTPPSERCSGAPNLDGITGAASTFHSKHGHHSHSSGTTTGYSSGTTTGTGTTGYSSGTTGTGTGTGYSSGTTGTGAGTGYSSGTTTTGAEEGQGQGITDKIKETLGFGGSGTSTGTHTGHNGVTAR